MKKIYLLIFAALALSACNDKFLDKTPLDKLSEDAVFNSDALAESYINALYTVLPDPYHVGCITDEGYFRYGGTSTRYIASGYMDPDNVMYIKEGGQAHNTRTTILNIWNRTYEWIYRMNYFLQYIDEKGSNMSESAKARLTGRFTSSAHGPTSCSYSVMAACRSSPSPTTSMTTSRWTVRISTTAWISYSETLPRPSSSFLPRKMA